MGTMSRRAAAPTMPHMALALLPGGLPGRDRHLPGARHRQLPGRRVLADGRARADIAVRAALGIPDVAEMVRFRAGADAACLDLDQVADVPLVGQAGAGPQ